MAARDVLDHEVAGSFSSRVASSGSGHTAENIAYGYDNFTKTLDQWIKSSGHRKNLLMQVASAGWCRERKKFKDWPHLLGVIDRGGTYKSSKPI